MFSYINVQREAKLLFFNYNFADEKNYKMEQIKGIYFLRNKTFYESRFFEGECSDIVFVVYEVVRIIDGIPLFCEEHYTRMENSLKQLGQPSVICYSDFEEQIKILARKNNCTEGNIKINLGEKGENICLYFMPHYYPNALEYKEGVRTGFYDAERNNPQVKVQMTELRENVNRYIKNQNYFEVFYVDRNQTITEGSRSNVFFVKDQTVYTSPAKQVLFGVTRQKVFKCLQNLGIALIERHIAKEEAKNFDAVFLTGTSPKILPVASIDGYKYRNNEEITDKIMKEYDRVVDEYIRSKK